MACIGKFTIFHLLVMLFSIATVLAEDESIALSEDAGPAPAEPDPFAEYESEPISELTGNEGSNETKLSVAQEASSYLQFKIGRAIQRYYLPIIVPIGFIGNCLSIMVMLRRHNRRVSCCVYMIALAISDNMMLFSGVYLWAIAEVSPRNWYLYECKFVCYCFGTFGFTGVYLVLFMTFDRWIAVNYPFKASTWCTVKRARLTCILVYVIAALYEIPHFLYAGIPGGRQCAPFTYSDPGVVAYTLVNLALNAFIPFVAICIMNAMIIRTILGRQEQFKHNKDDIVQNDLKNQQDAKALQQAKQLVAMLLLISFALVILTFPQYIRYVIWRFVNQNQSPAHFATYVLFFNISNKMFYTNNATNFFLYCAGGSRFRTDLKVILSCGIYEPPATSVSKLSSSTDSQVTKASRT